MQSEKKQLEELLIHYFREYYSEFPKGKLTSSESPDFVLKMKTRFHLGIEITRLNPVNAISPDKNTVAYGAFIKEVIEQAEFLFSQSMSLQLFVKVLFSDKRRITAERKLIVGARLANTVRETVRDKKTNSFFRESVPAKLLPTGIEEVLILHHPNLETAIWEPSNNLGISENVPADVQTAIQKKDEKMDLYQKQQLNNYWLIITTDRLRGTKNYNLQNKVLNQQFHSRFQQVFLFDLMRANIFRLL